MAQVLKRGFIKKRFETVREEDTRFDDNRSAEEFKNEFLRKRARITKQTFNKSSDQIEDIMADAYIDECSDAANGDVVSMDMLAYWFKRGNEVLPENIELSYKWLFLAAANGNKHSINKLQLFFNYAYDYIVYCDYFEYLKKAIDIDENNHQYTLGELLAKFMVEDMQINALELSKEKTIEVKFNQLSMQRFTKILDRVLPRIDDYFVNFVKSKNLI